MTVSRNLSSGNEQTRHELLVILQTVINTLKEGSAK